MSEQCILCGSTNVTVKETATAKKVACNDCKTVVVTEKPQ